uniref:Vascular endothelial growth factor A n=1 Tax=Heterorhabditis bacteriophora TaxID=37862 RepID=A0A1I7XM33_HETBA
METILTKYKLERDRMPNVFFYPGNSTRFYGKCSNLPEMNINVWMHCCDSGCSSMAEPSVRKRREHSVSCDVEGERKAHGQRWTPKNEQCTECKCEV